MIEQGRYYKLIYYMGKDLDYISDNMEQHKTVLRNIFGVEKFKEIENRVHWLVQNHKELEEDLR